MEVIYTIAPLPIDELKKYFINKDVVYHIDYDNSNLKGEKLLTYLGNLDLPCDISIDFSKQEHFDLFKIYLESGFLVKVPSLEKASILCLFEKRGLVNSDLFKEFIVNNEHTLKEWERRLDSLTLFNLYTLNDDSFKTWVTESHDEDTSDSTKFINFVNVLKYEEFFVFLSKTEQQNLKYYSKLFNDYCFKGKNLYEYWSNSNNPLFLLTWAIASGEMTPSQYSSSKEISINALS